MTRVFTLLAVALLVGLTFFVGPRIASSFAQDQDGPPVNSRSTTVARTPEPTRFPIAVTQDFEVTTGETTGPAVRYYVPSQSAFGSRQSSNFAPVNSRGGNSKTRKAYEVLKNSKDAEDDVKRNAEDDLREALEEEYDKSLEGYEANLAKLRKRLEALEDELDRRKSAKDELVDLKLKTLVHEANGLGWPGQGNQSFGFNYAPTSTFTFPSQSVQGLNTRQNGSQSNNTQWRYERTTQRQQDPFGQSNSQNRQRQEPRGGQSPYYDTPEVREPASDGENIEAPSRNEEEPGTRTRSPRRNRESDRDDTASSGR